MAVTYTIVPIPRWYFADNYGRPLGGGYMSTWRSVDKVTPKAIFTDDTGLFPWPNPVFFDANGEAPGPFFWADDEPYFLEVFDANNNLMFTMDNYGPGISGGGGGGGTIIVNYDLQNFVTNNVFWRNQGTLNNIQNGTVIAPSNHEGFVYGATGFSSIPYVGPDMMYVRSNDSSTDNLVFATTDFNGGDVPLTGDVTPEWYIDLSCTVAGNETSKAVQIPIDLKVKNLEQQTMTAIIWAKGVSGTQNLSMSFVQYFGTGSATTPVSTPISINASPLTNTWEPYEATFVVPSVLGKVLGDGGDDATYLQINFPTASTFRILVAKPKLYLGDVGQVFPELQTYDQVDTVISSPRTGDIRTSLNSFAPFGWVPANDGSIGSAASLATTRANIDTWQLYSLIWNSVLDNWAPVSGGRGVSAIADFSANKTLTLTRSLGRVMAGINASTITPLTFTANAATDLLTVSSTTTLTTGTPVQVTNSGGGLPSPLLANTPYFVINISGTTIKLATTIENAYAGTAIDITTAGTGTQTIQSALGVYAGESNHVLTIQEMPSHNHPGSTVPSVGAGNSSTPTVSSLGTNVGATGTIPLSIASQGGGSGHNTIQPTTYMNVFIKL